MTKIQIPKDKAINIDVLFHTLKANLPHKVYFKNPNKRDKITVSKESLLVHVKLTEKADFYEIKTQASHYLNENPLFALVAGIVLFISNFLGLLVSGSVLVLIILLAIGASRSSSQFKKEIVEFLNSYEFG